MATPSNLRRGSLVWANLGPTVGHEQRGSRPVLIISSTRFNERSGTVIAMPLTTQRPKAKLPFTIELPGSNPLSWVKVSQVRVLSNERLEKSFGERTPAEVDACLSALVVICSEWGVLVSSGVPLP